MLRRRTGTARRNLSKKQERTRNNIQADTPRTALVPECRRSTERKPERRQRSPRGRWGQQGHDVTGSSHLFARRTLPTVRIRGGQLSLSLAASARGQTTSGRFQRHVDGRPRRPLFGMRGLQRLPHLLSGNRSFMPFLLSRGPAINVSDRCFSTYWVDLRKGTRLETPAHCWAVRERGRNGRNNKKRNFPVACDLACR